MSIPDPLRYRVYSSYRINFDAEPDSLIERYFHNHPYYKTPYRLCQMILAYALQEGADALELSQGGNLRCRVNDAWVEMDGISNFLQPKLCSLLLILFSPFENTDAGLETTIELSAGEVERQFRIILTDMRVFGSDAISE